MSTQLFLSWSGELSRKVATQLHEWIPTVLQSVEPFLSSTDIEKGSRWSDHVAKKLEECGFGIIILTPDNTSAPWILFEAGALSKMVGRSHVSSLLIRLNLVDVKQPLSQFQNTVFNRDDVQKLLLSINRTNPSPLKDEVLLRTFTALWPEFEIAVNEIVLSHVVDDKDLIPKGDDLASLKDSVGELIQTVQALRDNTQTQDYLPAVKEIMREIRFDLRRSKNAVPPGLISDLRIAIDSLEESQSNPIANQVVRSEAVSEAIEKLRRAVGWLERHTRTDDYALFDNRFRRARPSSDDANEASSEGLE